MKFLLSYYRRHLWKVILCLLFLLPGSGISLAFPKLTGRLVDTTIHDGSGGMLGNLAGIFLGLLVIQAVVSYFTSTTLAKVTENVIGTLRTDLFAHIIRLPLSYISQQRIGELTSRLSSDLTQIQETFTFSIVQMIRQGVLLIGAIAVIVVTSLALTTPILIGTPIVVAVAVIMGRKIKRVSTATQDALARSASIVEESLQGIHSVKSFVMEGHETSRYSLAIASQIRLAIKGAKLRSLFVTFIITVVFGGIAGVIIYGANLVANHAITIGELLSFLMYAMFVAGALGTFAELLGQFQKTTGAAVRIREILAVEPELNTDAANARTETIVEDSAGPHVSSTAPPALEFVNVGFRYSDRSEYQVLSDVSMRIARSERVAFVGESGAGKSTVAALIQRLYEPTEGRIFYNGIPSEELDLSEVRRSVGIVPQDIVLFGGSVEENVRYGKQDASTAEIAEALRIANAMEFVEALPDGLQTVVGERGTKLSGGQRQRVAIARALLKNPPLLILDEATSALDAQSEHLIQQALERLMAHRTTIIIAHRLSTVRKCDRIVVFERGRIVEQGTHQELMATDNGRYRRWCDLQFIS